MKVAVVTLDVFFEKDLRKLGFVSLVTIEVWKIVDNRFEKFLFDVVHCK